MGILNSEQDRMRKAASEWEDRTSSDLFSMSQDSTLPPMFRQMAERGFDAIEALQNEKEILRAENAKFIQANIDVANINARLLAENERLEKVETVARQLVDGSHPNFVNKMDRCAHGIYGHEMCTNCYDEALLAALEGEQDNE